MIVIIPAAAAKSSETSCETMIEKRAANAVFTVLISIDLLISLVLFILQLLHTSKTPILSSPQLNQEIQM